eukprot:279069-Rhodomonas_salina.1
MMNYRKAKETLFGMQFVSLLQELTQPHQTTSTCAAEEFDSNCFTGAGSDGRDEEKQRQPDAKPVRTSRPTALTLAEQHTMLDNFIESCMTSVLGGRMVLFIIDVLQVFRVMLSPEYGTRSAAMQ